METKIIIHKSTSSNGYGNPFRVGRNNNKHNLFEEDLNGGFSEKEVSKIFQEIDALRRSKKIL